MKARLTKSEKNKLNASEKLIQYYRRNPVYAAKTLMDVDLVWFQRKTLKAIWNKMFIMVLMSRGLGKSWLGALAVCLYAILYPKTKIGIITPVFRQVGYFFDYIQTFYDENPYFRACCKKKIIRNMNREYIEFVNGSFIEGLPLGDGNKVRGRRYNFVLIDEYAQVPEDVIKLVIRPMLAVKSRKRNNKLVISSTSYYAWNHLYVQYLFHQVMQKKQPDLFAVCEYVYLDLIKLKDSPYEMDERIIAMSKADSTEEQWAMEYLCKFPISSSGFFPAKLIEECTPRRDDGSPIELEGRKDRSYVMGVDAARVEGGDNFVIQVLRLDGNIKRLVFTQSMNGQPYPVMADAVRNAIASFNVVRVFMDAQGGGTAIYDLISQPWINPITKENMQPIINMDNKDDERVGMRILKLINPTQPLNSEMFHGLKSEMEHGRMIFPITLRRNDSSNLEKANNEINQTKQELMMLIAEPLNQFFKFSAPANRKKDRAVSLALANFAAKDYFGVPVVVEDDLGMGLWVNS